MIDVVTLNVTPARNILTIVAMYADDFTVGWMGQPCPHTESDASQAAWLLGHLANKGAELSKGEPDGNAANH
jgi:hypothetical protein